MFPDPPYSLRVRDVEQPSENSGKTFACDQKPALINKNYHRVCCSIRFLSFLFAIIYVLSLGISVLLFKDSQVHNATVRQGDVGETGPMENFFHPTESSTSNLESTVADMYSQVHNATVRQGDVGETGPMENFFHPTESSTSNLESTVADMLPTPISQPVINETHLSDVMADICVGTSMKCTKNTTSPSKLNFTVQLLGDLIGLFLGEHILQCVNNTFNVMVNLDVEENVWSRFFGTQGTRTILRLTRWCFYLPKGIKLNTNLIALKIWTDIKKLSLLQPFLPSESHQKLF